MYIKDSGCRMIHRKHRHMLPFPGPVLRGAGSFPAVENIVEILHEVAACCKLHSPHTPSFPLHSCFLLTLVLSPHTRASSSHSFILLTLVLHRNGWEQRGAEEKGREMKQVWKCIHRLTCLARPLSCVHLSLKPKCLWLKCTVHKPYAPLSCTVRFEIIIFCRYLESDAQYVLSNLVYVFMCQLLVGV
jgi:hypothetical protein